VGRAGNLSFWAVLKKNCAGPGCAASHGRPHSKGRDPHQDATLDEAQANKFDLAARKLGLHEGMRLLDVGCGWGGMVMHAAREYGARALGVTLSARQAAWARAAIERAGLSGLAEPPRLLRVPARQDEAGRAAAEPLHHPSG
jgi:Mycolic acid cyclopropane synthetase